MNKFLFFMALSVIFGLVATKAEAGERVPLNCVRMAENMKLVTVNYNYGELRLDANNNTAEISQLCSDRAAGCFHGPSGLIINVDVTKVDVGASCQAFQIAVNYDFSGSKIYVTNEYNPCNTRAVLRHELQHFMIWKTSKEQLVRETKIALKRWSIQNIERIGDEERNTKNHAQGEVYKIVNGLMSKWAKLEADNDKVLDDTDHDTTTEVNYSVCSQYELEIM